MKTENEMIRTLLAEAPPSAHATGQARQRLTDEIRGARPIRRRSPRTWRLSLAGSGLAGVAAVGVAFALAAGTPGTTGLGRPAGGGTGVAAPPAAAAAVDASAPQLLLAAAGRTDDTFGTGRLWHVRTIWRGSLYTPVQVRGEKFYLAERRVDETWTPRSGDGRAWEGSQELGARPRTSADLAAWKRAGSPSTFDLGAGDTAEPSRVTRTVRPGKGRLSSYPAGTERGAIGPIALAGLPAEPGALRAAAEALIKKDGGVVSDSSVFSLLGRLLTESPAGPQLRAAAFTLLSGLPDVVNAGEREDASGRTGIALELTRTIKAAGGTFVEKHWLILDPATFTLLGVGSKGVTTDADGTEHIEKGGKEFDAAVITAEWTDARPVAPNLK